MSSYSRQQLENWLRMLDIKADSVLDVGGSQLPIKNRVKSWDVKDYKILDLEVPHECKQNPDIVWDLNNPFGDGIYRETTVIEHYENMFDAAFCLEVSEYWYNPINSLRTIRYMMKHKGTLYLSFHFIYPIHNPSNQDYLRYTPNGVRKILDEAGFDIKDMVPRLYEEVPPMSLYLAEGMKPARDSQEHDWTGCLVECIKR